MTLRLLHVLPLAVLALLFHAARAGAQVHGAVVDDRGAPLDGVVVELWDAAAPRARTITGGDGRFSFPADSVPPAAQLVARRTGYQPLRQPVLPGPQPPLRLRLQVAAHALAPVVVEGADACPARDVPQARAAWQRVRDRYRQPDSLDMTAQSSKYVGRVPSTAENVREGMRPLLHSYWAAGLRHSQTRDQILAGGYARRMSGVNMDPEFDTWSYVQLYRYPQHFSDAVFGELHTFSVVSDEGADVVVRFCPLRTDRPAIQGTMVLTRDGVLKEAEWTYRMPAEPRRRRRAANAWPSERAGGKVVLRPDAPGAARPLLLPLSALYWRTTHFGDYYYNWEEFTEWRVTPATAR